MFHRPLHRWKSFWFGILILAFLGCSWVQSMRYLDILYWNHGKFVLTAGQALGWVEVRWDASKPSPLISHWSHQIITLTPEETWFARAVRVKRHPGRLEVFIAHWLLILLFSVPWAIWLCYRHRSMKRLDAGT